MRQLLRDALRRHPVLAGAVLLFQGLQSVAMLLLPRLTADVIDRGVLPGDTGRVRAVGLVMLAVAALQLASAVAAIWFASRLSMGLGRDLRADLFHHVLGFSTREVGRFGAPSLITRITNDVQQVQMLVLMICTQAVTAPFTVVAGTVLALRQDARLSLVLLGAIPAFLVCVGLLLWRTSPVYGAMQDHLDSVNRVLREQIMGIRVVRAFVREPVERQRFADENARLTGSSVHAGRLLALLFPVLMLIFHLASAAVVWFGAVRVENGEASVGALLAFLSYIVQILGATMMATFTLAMAPRAAVCARRIREVLDTPGSVADPAEPVAVRPGGGGLELRDVSFGYPGADAPVLAGISVVVRPGETLALIGSTGAGKTTLLGLIPRLFDVTAGQVLVDGVDVRDQALDELWRRIGLVPQRPYLFSGTVASNLRDGNPHAGEDELWEALHVAQASDFVVHAGGLDAPVAQGGANLSGGQRQRLAIARALVGRPSIHLFDDSFSALDLATEARLRHALPTFTARGVVVVVAQRVSSVVDADQVLVLEDGRAVGLGTHEELLASCPTYQEIAESQAVTRVPA